MKARLWVLVLICFAATPARAQLPVEVFAGQQRATLDLMFFRYFDQQPGAPPGRWLFFHRSRAAIDYRMTATEYLPQFGSTEAVSYNHPAAKGLAPVAVLQLLNSGLTPKLGIQFARITPQWTLFSWSVVELRQQPNVDFFLLLRYTPRISERWKGFFQVEWIPSVPTEETKPVYLTSRGRAGLSRAGTQFGIGCDLQQWGRSQWTTTTNAGVFIRKEF